MRIARAQVIVLLLLTGAATLASQPLWADPSETSSADARAEKLVAAATPEELQHLVEGTLLFFAPPKERPTGVAQGSGYVPGIPRLGIPPQTETDASLGVANLGGVMRPKDEATAMPASLAVAASFDPAIARAGGAMIGSEAKAKGFNVMLAGGVNLTRDPRGGRNFEYAGEDPLLAGRMTGAQIAGIQSNGMISTIKHYALNDQETGRTGYSVEMPEEVMRESDLLAFRIAIEAGNPGSVMCSYNRVGGRYACENPFLLTQVLRQDWKWPGYVMSDWGAVHSSEAITVGLDQESASKLDGTPWFGAPLTAKLKSGAIPQSALTTAAHRILRTMLANGVVGPDWTARTPIDYAAHAEVARHAAEAGIVLLKNEGGLLPLINSARRIVVIGGHADVGVLAGGGSSQVRPVGGPALLLPVPGTTGIMALITKTLYDPSSPLRAMQAALPSAHISYDNGTDVARAARAAKAADVAIVFATREESEGKDLATLDLPDGQDELIAAVARENPHAVVVLETGNPVLMPWRDQVGAIVEAWYPGQKGGDAIANVLTGRVNPSGRLPITFPASIDQIPNPTLAGSNLPKPKDQAITVGMAPTAIPSFPVTYPEGSNVGYRWYDARHRTPLFAFGHGLSYTRFKVGGVSATGGRSLTVRFTVSNVGARAGADTPQVYVRVNGARRLVGWQKVVLQPGQSKSVTVIAEPRIMATYDRARHRYVVAPGSYDVEIGESATAIVGKTVAKLLPATLAP